MNVRTSNRTRVPPTTGPRKPTAANTGQRRPTAANRARDAYVSPASGMFFFRTFFLLYRLFTTDYITANDSGYGHYQHQLTERAEQDQLQHRHHHHHYHHHHTY